MSKLDLYPGVPRKEIEKHLYYVRKTERGLVELRQTRFLDTDNHPWDIMSIARDIDGLKTMCPSWDVIWPETTLDETPEKPK